MTITPAAEKTLPMDVARITFLIDLMHRDCGFLQYLRELTINSITAVQMNPDGKGEVVWDYDQRCWEEDGVYKLTITDNGIGLSPEDLCQCLNRLAYGKSEHGFDKNYGVGGKISALPLNHAGLIYRSWQDGEGHQAWLWRDPETQEYGIRTFHGNPTPHLAPGTKPNLIQAHGTRVLLLGMDPKDSTMDAPKDAPAPSRWIARALNTRFFVIPDGVKLSARERWTEEKGGSSLRPVYGQKFHLDKQASSKGCLSLKGAQAYWWVMPEKVPDYDNSWVLAGHVAALHRGELYDLRTGKPGYNRLQQFGVLFGPSRVVLYVEPDITAELSTDTARAELLLKKSGGDQDLPWSEWAEEFRSQMPREITDMMDEVLAHSHTKNGDVQAIWDRLRSIAELFRPTRYRRAAGGKLMVEAENPGSKNENSSTRPKRSSEDEPKPRNPALSNLLAALNGRSAEEVLAEWEKPKFKWVSLADKSREPGVMEDRAAQYLIEQRYLVINSDFRIFTDMVDRYAAQYPPVSRPVIEATVHEWFTQVLFETVLGVESLKGSKEWSDEDLQKATSEAALTAAVMQRYHTNLAIKRTLGSKLGPIQEKAS